MLRTIITSLQRYYNKGCISKKFYQRDLRAKFEYGALALSFSVNF